jgi:hypothetical protein
VDKLLRTMNFEFGAAAVTGKAYCEGTQCMDLRDCGSGMEDSTEE